MVILLASAVAYAIKKIKSPVGAQRSQRSLNFSIASCHFQFFTAYWYLQNFS